MPSSLQRFTQTSPLSLPATSSSTRANTLSFSRSRRRSGGSPREEIPLRPTLLSRVRPEEGPARLEGSASNHRSTESGHLALPDVLPARARHRLRGKFLCQRLPADGTIFTPHLGPAF